MHTQNNFEYLGCVYIPIYTPKYFELFDNISLQEKCWTIGFALMENKVCLKIPVLCVLNFNPSYSFTALFPWHV